MAEAHITKKTYWKVFAVLMILLFLTVLIAYLHVNPWLAIIAAMTIAIVKAVLVILYFMHVKYNSRLTWLFVVSAFFWLLIMIGITLTDYKTRPWERTGYQDKEQQFSSPSQLPATMYPQNENYKAGHGHAEEPAGEGEDSGH